MSLDGIIIVALREDYSNTIEEEIEKERNEEQQDKPVISKTYINGETLIYPYDERIYTIIGASNGIWSIDNPKIKILNQDEEKIEIFVDSGKSGNFILKYIREGEDDITLSVTIDSL